MIEAFDFCGLDIEHVKKCHIDLSNAQNDNGNGSRL